MRRTNWKQVVTAVGLMDSSSRRVFVKIRTLPLFSVVCPARRTAGARDPRFRGDTQL